MLDWLSANSPLYVPARSAVSWGELEADRGTPSFPFNDRCSCAVSVSTAADTIWLRRSTPFLENRYVLAFEAIYYWILINSVSLICLRFFGFTFFPTMKKRLSSLSLVCTCGITLGVIFKWSFNFLPAFRFPLLLDRFLSPYSSSILWLNISPSSVKKGAPWLTSIS